LARDPEIAVVGAGIVGLATAYALARAGAPPRVYERGVPGNGQSGGESRVFRHAHDDPRLVRLAVKSRALWEEWGEELGVELVSGDGVVAIGPTVEERLAALQRVPGTRARAIGPAELAARLPLLAGYSGPAVIDDVGGAIRTREAVVALVGRLAEGVRPDEVISIRPTARGTVEVRAGGERSEHARVVVCAGRGTAALARGIGLSLPVREGAHVRLTFAVRGEPPARVACLLDGSGAFGEAGTYAAPEPGNRSYSVGLAQSVEARGDGSLVDPAHLASLADRAAAYVARALPGLHPEPVESRHCWTTTLSWGDDGLAVWEAEGISFVAGNNLYKHAPALGRALARAALGAGLAEELRPEARLGEPRP
jgi:sarcosine oxidase